MRIGLTVNRDKPEAREFVSELVEWLRDEGYEPVLATSTARDFRLKAECCPARDLVRRVDLVVALGGDGTLLRTARLIGRHEVPIMGVNLGGLGFLTEFSVGEARRGIRAFARGRHREERRMVLACHCGRRRGFVLNDCAVNMGRTSRVIKVVARTTEDFITRFVGDGVVISTPTGSTAYSLAAGGPVVYPTMDAILLTPLSPHALATRPIILPADVVLELELAPESEPATLNLDGQQVWRLAAGRPVHVTRADFHVRLVAPRRKTYFSILRDKMKWSGGRI